MLNQVLRWWRRYWSAELITTLVTLAVFAVLMGQFGVEGGLASSEPEPAVLASSPSPEPAPLPGPDSVPLSAPLPGPETASVPSPQPPPWLRLDSAPPTMLAPIPVPLLPLGGVAGAGGLPLVPASSDLVVHTARTDRVVALTFDDGPHPEYTPQVLALLARYRAVATFCVLGSQAQRYPQLVRDMVAAGMRLCGHTMTHDKNLIYRPEPEIEAEIVDGRDAMLAAAGQRVTVDYFRAPYGRWSDPMRAIAARHGMRPLSWSVDPRDWSRPGVAHIVASVQQQVHPGAVILLHDGGGRRDQTVAALEQLLPWLISQGYQFGVP